MHLLQSICLNGDATKGGKKPTFVFLEAVKFSTFINVVWRVY